MFPRRRAFLAGVCDGVKISSGQLARLFTDDCTHGVEGFTATLTLLACQRVSNAMWSLADHAAAEFGRHWAAAIGKRAYVDNPGRHAFPVALKEALANYR